MRGVRPGADATGGGRPLVADWSPAARRRPGSWPPRRRGSGPPRGHAPFRVTIASFLRRQTGSRVYYTVLHAVGGRRSSAPVIGAPCLGAGVGRVGARAAMAAGRGPPPSGGGGGAARAGEGSKRGEKQCTGGASGREERGRPTEGARQGEGGQRRSARRPRTRAQAARRFQPRRAALARAPAVRQGPEGQGGPRGAGRALSGGSRPRANRRWRGARARAPAAAICGSAVGGACAAGGEVGKRGTRGRCVHKSLARPAQAALRAARPLRGGERAWRAGGNAAAGGARRAREQRAPTRAAAPGASAPARGALSWGAWASNNGLGGTHASAKRAAQGGVGREASCGEAAAEGRFFCLVCMRGAGGAAPLWDGW
jgi:hypothetical protein